MIKSPEMKIRRSGMSAALLAALPYMAAGQVMTGNDILTICTSDDPAQAGACAGWGIGVNEGIVRHTSLHITRPARARQPHLCAEAL